MRRLEGLAVLALLAGCGSQSSGITELQPGLFGLTVTGRNLAGATDRALTEATAYCTGLGRQTQIMGTQMGAAAYDLVFRCTGRTVQTEVPPAAAAVASEPASQPQPAAATLPLLPAATAPVVNGVAFGRPLPANSGPAASAARQAAAAPVSALPAAPPTLPALRSGGEAGAVVLPPIAGR